MAVAEEQESNGVGHRLPSGQEDEAFGTRLQRARATRGWSQPRLIAEMRRAALQLFGHQLPCDSSLKAMVSRWENNWREPDRYNRRVLAAALGLSEDLLGSTAPEEVAEP
jgi:transcriptional regulator with XRE-family HTH domain